MEHVLVHLLRDPMKPILWLRSAARPSTQEVIMSGATMDIRGAVCLSVTMLSLTACVGKPDQDDAAGATTTELSASDTGAATDTAATTSDHLTSEATSGDPTGPEPESTGTTTGDTGVGTTSGTTSDGATEDGSTGTTDGGWQWGGCEPVWPQTGPVSGMTPVGELAFEYAAFDADGCGPIEMISLVLFPEMPVLDADLELSPTPYRLDVALIGDGWSDNWVREGPVHVALVDDSQQVVAASDGTLTITMLDIEDTSFMGDGGLSHWLVGDLVVEGPGWALQGEFAAALCWMYGGAALCP